MPKKLDANFSRRSDTKSLAKYSQVKIKTVATSIRYSQILTASGRLGKVSMEKVMSETIIKPWMKKSKALPDLVSDFSSISLMLMCLLLNSGA